MKANNLLRVGIVGCGSVAQRWHIPALLKMKGVRLAAVCDTNENVAKQVAESSHIPRYYAALYDMLSAEKLDMVDICTPPGTHASLSIAAMESGCHVLVEKPMALSTKEADEMIKTFRSNNVKLCIIHNKLFQPMIMKARSMVNKGLVGELAGIDLRDGWRKGSAAVANKDHWYHKLPGGIFGETLPHPIYLATAFWGRLEPVAVYLKKLSSYEWVTADEVRIILEGERGLATITASCNWPKGGATVDIFGTKRNLHIDVHSGVLTELGAGGERRLGRALDNLRQSYQLFACTASAAFNALLGKHYSGHHNLIEKFVDAIRNDTDPPVRAEEGKEVVRVMEKIAAQMIGELPARFP